jgi:threonine dehydratase
MQRPPDSWKRLTPTAPVEAAAPPSVAQVRAAAERIAPHVIRTPVAPWRGPRARALFGANTEVWVKMEVFQAGGSFKARGALNTILQLAPEERARGLTAFSSGNHAIAVAYAAQMLGVSAKVVMPSAANPARVSACRELGAEVVFAQDGAGARQMMLDIVSQEGRVAIHPYEGQHVTQGTGTIALEINEQVPDLDAVLVSIGGGGLCSGLASTMKQLRPQCRILAVEPEGADTMYRAFATGQAQTLERAQTIADCLAPPQTQPYSMGLCMAAVDELALIPDAEMVDAMNLLYDEFRLAVEPGGAASTAAAIGPYRDQIEGKKVLIFLCGSNIDLGTFSRITSGAERAH